MHNLGVRTGGKMLMSEKLFCIANVNFGIILEQEKKLFNDIEEKKNFIINKWNSVVDKDDYVFHIGNFLTGDRREANVVCSQLNGRIYLINDKFKDVDKDKWANILNIEKAINYGFFFKQEVLKEYYPNATSIPNILSVGTTPNDNHNLNLIPRPEGATEWFTDNSLYIEAFDWDYTPIELIEAIDTHLGMLELNESEEQ